MSFKIVENLKYGKGSLKFKLKEGDIVADVFFEHTDIPRLLERKLISPSDSNEISIFTFEEVKQIPDISKMAANDVRDLIESINDPVVIEKMIDKESLVHPPRKNVLSVLGKRSKELSPKM